MKENIKRHVYFIARVIEQKPSVLLQCWPGHRCQESYLVCKMLLQPSAVESWQMSLRKRPLLSMWSRLVKLKLCNNNYLKALIEFKPTPYCCTLTFTFDRSTPNHVTSNISQGYSYTMLQHFGIIHFWVMLRLLVWKMHLLTLWPWLLTFQPLNHVTSRIS